MYCSGVESKVLSAMSLGEECVYTFLILKRAVNV